jgi:hypothetical protein
MKCLLPLVLLFAFAVHGNAQSSGAKKVFMITDMEGVSGIFDTELQCVPYKSVRFEESRKLLTGEINAAVDGLFEGGATEVVEQLDDRTWIFRGKDILDAWLKFSSF